MSQGALNKRMKHFSMILNHFWRRWKKEYLLSLRECHRYSKGASVKRALWPGDIVVMCGDGSRRGFWRLARIDQLIEGIDEQVRGAAICVSSRGDKRPAILRHPVTHLYPLEINCCVGNTEETVDGNARSVSIQQSQLYCQKTHSQLRTHSFNLDNLGEQLLKGQENGCKPSSVTNLF